MNQAVKDKHGLQYSLHSKAMMSMMARLNSRIFTKSLSYTRFQKYLPSMLYRKRAKLQRCSRQMQQFAISIARKQLEKIIASYDRNLEVCDYIMLREKSGLKFEEEFDEQYQFWSQMEQKMQTLIIQAESSSKEHLK